MTTRDHIRYTKGYKYQLEEDYESDPTGVEGYSISTPFVSLTSAGVLHLARGYAWDGPSGPTLDTLDSMRGSAEHDGFYKLMRMGLIPLSERAAADRRFLATILQDGMNPARANFWFAGVDHLAAAAANPKNKKRVHRAPISEDK
jgi:hypothetical protein